MLAMPDCGGAANNSVRDHVAAKSGKFEPIDKVLTPSYLCRSASQAQSGGALYVARRIKPEKRAQGASARPYLPECGTLRISLLMFAGLARKMFGSANDRRIKGYRPRVDEINALEKELEALSDEALRARTEEFKKQVADDKTLDDILVPAFATVREAAKRTLGQRHVD